MPGYVEFALLFGVGSVAGIINVMAGGGSTLSLPTLIFLGLDGGMANGTNRVAIVVQNVVATLSFKAEGVSRLRRSALYAVWALPGAIGGAIAAVRVSDLWFERILSVVMIVVVVSMLFPRKSGAHAGAQSGSKWIYPSLFCIGFYGGFIQMGVGFLFMAAFYHMMRMNLVVTTVHKVVIVLFYTVPALLIFAATGHVDWGMGVCLAAGNAAGAWGATKMAIRGGERAIRYVLSVAVLLMAAKMLGAY